MTIQLATKDFPTSTSPKGREQVADVCMGVDLSLLGAVSAEAFDSFGADLPVEYANYPQLASCAYAANRGGVDFVSLKMSFRSRSDAPSELDAVRVASRLTMQDEIGVSAEVPADVEAIDEAIGILSEPSKGWTALITRLTAASDIAMIAKAAERAKARGLRLNVKIRPEDLAHHDIASIVSFAESVRLLTDDPHGAREARFALRSAAAELGRDLCVLAEIGIVISGSMAAANERALLVEAMTGAPVFEGKPSVIGTVYDAADVVERWIGLGAADGIVFLPASLPTDLASVIRGVLPLLNARGAESQRV
ncbi:MAG: hypothetical protein Q3979_00910 [Actinomycetaceae bacterium]|nr:hypothetical protein [Actinomycetaceae bacterium]